MKKQIKMICHKCLWKWNYKGTRTIYASCPNCMSQVKIKGEEAGLKQSPSFPQDSIACRGLDTKEAGE